MAIHLTAIIKSKPEKTAEVKLFLLEMVQKSTKEEACMQYELFQEQTDSSIFIFHEIWKDQEGFEKHNQQKYIQAFFERSNALLQEAPLVYFNNKLS